MEFRRVVASNVAVVCAAGIAVGISQSASAAVITPGLYNLNNHPNGHERPPLYGLRLDDLFDVNQGTDEFTFSFVPVDGAAMFLDFDGTSVHIFGTAVGGLDIGGIWDPNWTSQVVIDFTYQITTAAAGDDDRIVDPSRQGMDSGSLTWLDTNEVFTLGNQTFDGLGYSFRLGDQDNDMGHRGFQGISGWGWLTVNGQDLPGAQDWLFTAELIPAPGALALLGVAGLTARRRRRN